MKEFGVMLLKVCLASNPSVCETVNPGYTDPDTGRPPTFFECRGLGGQVALMKYLSEHPRFGSGRVICGRTNNPQRTIREKMDIPA